MALSRRVLREAKTRVIAKNRECLNHLVRVNQIQLREFRSVRPIDRAVTYSSLKRKVRGSNLGPVKSDTVLPTARHSYDISSKGAVLTGRNDAEMDPQPVTRFGVMQRV